MAIVWTVLRVLATNVCFTPLARSVGLKDVNAKKFPESAWKILFYSFTWSLSVYVVLVSGRYNYFEDPCSVWIEWYIGMPVPRDIYAMYIVQCSFYLHSIYGTIFLDIWRKDTGVMLVHHLLTLALIAFSYATRYHKIGTLVLLVHDITDIQLEFTKLNIYLRNRYGVKHMLHEHLANIGFGIFTVCWFIFRLYWYPLKVLFSTGHGAMNYGPEEKNFFLFFNSMLWILQCMNVYWFGFILLFLYKLFTGQMTEVDDTRDFDAGEAERQRKRLESLSLQNNLSEKVEQKNGKHEQNGVITPITDGDLQANGEPPAPRKRHIKRVD